MRRNAAEVAGENARLHGENDVLSAALYYVVAGETSAGVEKFKIDGASYTFTLYGPNRPDGGILLERMRIAGQRDMIRAYRFEDYQRGWQGRCDTASLPLRCALERLDRIRRMVIDNANTWKGGSVA